MDIQEINYEWGEDDPIFLSATYLKLLSNEYGWFGGFEQGKLRLVIAYIIKKKYIFRYAQFQTEIICVAGEVFRGHGEVVSERGRYKIKGNGGRFLCTTFDSYRFPCMP